jgi:hypothetical protein
MLGVYVGLYTVTVQYGIDGELAALLVVERLKEGQASSSYIQQAFVHCRALY